MKYILLSLLLLFSLPSLSQTVYENKSKVYSFEMPNSYESKESNHERNEFIFVNKTDTTSLVVNVNDVVFNKNEIQSFKKASNAEVEINYFKILKDPKIIARGELTIYPEQSIFFHVRHSANTEKENDFMLTYLFYNKGKEINFIFRTKERRLAKVLTEIEKIVNSVKLL